MRMTVLAAALSGVLACGSDGTGGGSPGRVTVANNVFSPQSVTPDNANQVLFTWSSGGVLHNVTWEDLTPGSGNLGTGTYVRDFTGAGSGQVYRYRCSIHSADFNAGMIGQVVIP
jgi:plastocyanin